MTENKSRTWRTLGVAAVIAAVVAIVVGIAIYRDQVAPFRTTVLVVDDQSISMRYFLKRIYLSGQEPLQMLQTLTNEQIIRKVAPQPPYNVSVDDNNVDAFFREFAAGRASGAAEGSNQTISDEEFKEWYRQQLNESMLSDEEFRDLGRTNLMTRRLAGLLADNVPTVAEQAFLNMIVVSSLPQAREIRERLEAGEDFAAVAREVSTDEGLRDNGGVLGWYPRGALSPSMATAAFDELDVGQVSEPLFLGEESVAVIMVSERAAARQIEEEPLERMRAAALGEWLRQEAKFHEVEFHGFHNGYDSETDAWVQWQLARMRRSGNRRRSENDQ
jgi:foldase protein PrsA